MNPVLFAILIGTLFAVVSVVFAFRFVRKRVQQLPDIRRPRWAITVASVVAVLSFPFAWWVGFVIGGNFGGATIASLGERDIATTFWIPIGIGGGIAIVTTSIVVLLSGIAFGIAKSIEQK